MKKIIKVLLTFALLFGFSFSYTEHAEAIAKAVSYSNCTELNKVYKGGVAKAANIKNKGGKTKYKPFVSLELYNANKSKDRDKDGIACEK